MADFSNMSRLFSTAGANKQQQGTGYTNLNRLFEANKNNQLGQKVAGDISNQIGGVKTQLGQQQQDFQKESEANKLDTDTNKQQRDAVLGRFSSASGAGGDLSDQDLQNFTKFRSGEYAGPQGLKDTAGLSSTASGLAQQTSAFSPSGTQELLRRTVGGDKYSQGQSRLDSLLLDRSKLAPIQRQASSLNQDINRANLAAQSQAQLLKNQAQQFGQETTNKLNEGLTGIDTSVQGQLKAAQDAENQRLANIQAIQNFAQNKVAKVDASGNPVRDDYGNIVYDTSAQARGTGTSAAEQADYLRNLLSGQGANAGELTNLFGTGSLNDQYNQYNTKNAELRRNELADIVGATPEFLQTNFSTQQSGGNGKNGNQLPRQLSSYQNDILSRISDYQAQNKDKNLSQAQALSDLVRSGAVSESALNQLNNASDITQQSRPQNLAARAAEDKYRQDIASNLEGYKQGTGLAGQALLGGSQEDLFKNLAASLANSPQAQNLTAQGVASQAQRQNYEALTKLLGKTAADSKYQQNADQYQAGKYLLNPEQIKKSLGY